MIAAELLAPAGPLGIGASWAQQDQGPAAKAGSRLDDVGRSIKRGLDNAGEAVGEQFVRARSSVHNMDVASRVYGRLHWDKSLATSSLDLDVKGGVVTLRGSVPDAKAKVKAVELAADTVGISSVINQLAIQPQPRTTPDAPIDARSKF